MNILTLTYLGNIQWFSKLCCAECVIDLHEHYVKQSYRSRCDILSANGPVSLSVQTIKGSNTDKETVRETRLDYSKRWQHQHWQSLVSAYKNSPYFDYYEEQLAPFYERRFTFLADLNLGLLETLLQILGCSVTPRFSEEYLTPGPDDHDFRSCLSPKPRLWRPDPEFTPVPYYQVFTEKMAFIPNLSVLDLLLCEGPEALSILRRCYRPRSSAPKPDSQTEK